MFIDDVGTGPAAPLVSIVRVLGLKPCVPTLEQRYRASRQLNLYDGYSYKMKATFTSETRIATPAMRSLEANLWKPMDYWHCCDAMT